MRLFRWRNYRDYGTGVAGDLFVHLFSGMHYIMGTHRARRAFSPPADCDSGKMAAMFPDIMLGLYDYPETANHPAFNLALRVNFVNGSGETYGFRFVGSEGVLSIGRRRHGFETAARSRSRATPSTRSRKPSRSSS